MRPTRAADASSRAGARRARSAAGLTAERIREQALRLIDAEGLESFSTRKLGRALGCEAMAIYWYYPSKDALLDAVVDELMAGLGRVAVKDGGDWTEALRDVARAFRGLARRHPRAFPLVASRTFSTESTYAFLESLFALARARGIDDRTAARFFRAVGAYCSGFGLNEIATRAEEKDPRAPAVRAKFERVSAVSKWLAPRHADDLFEFGLDVLLGALARSVDEAAAS
jgi:AcrR family transcriptional regulator